MTTHVRANSGNARTDRSPRGDGATAASSSVLASPLLRSFFPGFSLSFLRFLLVVAGVSAGVVGTWNVDRHDRVDSLREELRRKESLSFELRHALAEERKVYDGLATDPRLEMHYLEHIFGPAEERGIPLDRWLAGERFEPDP